MVESVKDTVKARLGKIKLLASTEELKQLKSHQLLIFIKRLQIYVKTQQRLIHSLRRKQQVKKSQPQQEKLPQNKPRSHKTTSTQTDASKPEQLEEKADDDNSREQVVSGFLEDIKKAATEGMIKQMGLVYEPTSGLYYDATTGYYYNAEYNLYYDGEKARWLKYNEESFEYEFYSDAMPTDTNKQVHDSDVNSLLKDFSNLGIDRMRQNALDVVRLYKDKDGDFKRKRRRGSRSLSRSYSGDDYLMSKRDKKKRKKERRSDSKKKRRNRSSSSDLYKSRSRSKSRDRDRKKKNKKSKSRKHKSRSRSRSQSRPHSRSGSKHQTDIEEGELSQSDSSHHVTPDEDAVEHFRHPRADIAAKYPPSLRLIVQETDLEKLKVGALFIVTYKGGTLGREGTHDVLIPAALVSKTHLQFTYNRDKDEYQCEDLGSRNGTVLNGKRMSESKVKSGRKSLKHDSVIELDKTKILCHIHEGLTTCVKCEPGLVQSEVPKPTSTAVVEVLSHKEGLKQLQKLYGLEKTKYVEEGAEEGASKAYTDRAKERRKKVGGTNHREKTEVASVDTSIANSNKGFKMLSKLGWSEGQSLGKGDTGLKEPISMVSNDGKRGLGCEEPIAPINPSISKYKAMIISKTQQRYNKSNTATAIIDVSSDDSD